MFRLLKLTDLLAFPAGLGVGAIGLGLAPITEN